MFRLFFFRQGDSYLAGEQDMLTCLTAGNSVEFLRLEFGLGTKFLRDSLVSFIHEFFLPLKF